MIWFILILCFLYIATGLISNLINIYYFFTDKFDGEEEDKSIKKKLEE